jgi:tetratricopeptide (TPR) repeat protein
VLRLHILKRFVKPGIAMQNFLWALGGGLATVLLMHYGLDWSWMGSLGLSLIVVLTLLVVLARRSFFAWNALLNSTRIFMESNPPRLDLAISKLQQGLLLGRRQFGLGSQIQAQIGILLFLQRDFAKAQSAFKKGGWMMPWVAHCMLAVCYYKKKDIVRLKKTLNMLPIRTQKEPLAIGLQAYLWQQINELPQALQILHRGIKDNPQNAELKDLLQHAQNGKKIKMKVFGQAWYQFHLERPPQVLVQAHRHY